MKLIKLGIADSHKLFCGVLKNFLSHQPRIRTIFDTDEANLLEVLKTSRIDVLLLEVVTPNMNGIQTLKAVREQYPAIKVIILSMASDLELVDQLFELGIHAYISKSDEPENLLQAIIAAAEDNVYRNKILTDALYYTRSEGLKRNTTVDLDEREKRILQMLWEEKSNQEIADEFLLGVRSVEKIRRALKEKLGTKSAVGLIKYALNNKLIDIPTIR